MNAIGVALLLGWLATGWGLTRAEPSAAGALTFAFVLLGWVLSVMAHEFAHAGVAYLGGDVTVAQKGYLSFDPRRYGDVGTSLVLPLLALVLGGFGLPGGAVYLRPDLMRGPGWRAAAALAGPGATLAVFAALTTATQALEAGGGAGDLVPAVAVLAFLQAMALILNLLPIPGLDGFNAFKPFLPARVPLQLAKIEGLGMGLLFLAIFLVPGVGAFLFRAAAQLSFAAGIDPALPGEGWRAFRFWR